MRLLMLTACAGAILSGCSIHPLPEDASGDSSFEIVAKIRCEARNAIKTGAIATGLRNRTIDELSERDLEDFHEKLNEIDRELERIDIKFKIKEMAKKKKIDFVKTQMYPRFIDSAIALGFELTMAEGNKGSATANFAMPFSTGKFLLGISAGEEKERKNVRTFIMVHSFAELLADSSLIKCETESSRWRYPITGTVGLEETIETYTKLAGIQGFGTQLPKKSNSGDGQDEPKNPAGQGTAGPNKDGQAKSDLIKAPNKENGTPRYQGSARQVVYFTEELTFSTIYKASIAPEIELVPVGNKFRLIEASGSAGGERRDVHKLIVSIVVTEKNAQENQNIATENVREIQKDSKALDGFSEGLKLLR